MNPKRSGHSICRRLVQPSTHPNPKTKDRFLAVALWFTGKCGWKIIDEEGSSWDMLPLVGIHWMKVYD